MFLSNAVSTGSAVTLGTLAGNCNSSSASTSARSDFVVLDPSALCASAQSSLASMGTPRQIGAAMERMQRDVVLQMQESYTQLGEIDRNVVGRADDFIDRGDLPEESINEDMFTRVAGLNAADVEQTRESRRQTMLQAGMEWLEAAKEPGLNLLHVAGRTGSIVALTVVLRQVIAYHVEQALREGDSPEATRAWAVVAMAMIGPALTLMGAIRSECDGTASPASRLGRVCMASVTMGGLIAAHLTGASKTLLPAMLGGSVYTLARGLANVFIPLQDNAGRANAATTGAATAAYGAAQFLVAELGQLAPLSGGARAAAELGYSLGADAIQGLLNGFGMVVDDVVSILCKSWHVLSPNPGLDSVFSDPQVLQQTVLEVRAGVQRPTRTQLADALLNIGAMRLSAGHAIALVTAAVASLLSHSEVEDDYQGHIMSGCLALMAMIIYFPLVFSCAKRTDNSYTLQETVIP
jgi:hypothetical protein